MKYQHHLAPTFWISIFFKCMLVFRAIGQHCDLMLMINKWLVNGWSFVWRIWNKFQFRHYFDVEKKKMYARFLPLWSPAFKLIISYKNNRYSSPNLHSDKVNWFQLQRKSCKCRSDVRHEDRHDNKAQQDPDDWENSSHDWLWNFVAIPHGERNRYRGFLNWRSQDKSSLIRQGSPVSRRFESCAKLWLHDKKM